MPCAHARGAAVAIADWIVTAASSPSRASETSRDVVLAADRRNMVSHNGTLGHDRADHLRIHLRLGP